MKAFRKKTQTLSLGLPFAMALTTMAAFTLNGCGSDDTSSANNETGYVTKYSSEASDTPETSSESKVSDNSSSSTKSDTPTSSASKPPQSSSAKQETQSSEEVLNEPSKKVSGTCYAKTSIIEKGGVATWEFARSSGDVFDGIMAPYIWTFADIDKTLQGNGLNSVNLKYESAGTYNAKLSVDGNEITCSPLQVQGIPITITSCKPDKETANAGETVTWTVEATSEADITGYAWTYENEPLSGSGTSAAVALGSDLHKVNTAPTVTVTNSDNTSQSFVCANTYVINPNKVDYTLVTGAEPIEIPTAEVWVVDIPADAMTLVCETKGTINVLVNDEALSEEPKIDYFGVSITAYKGQKVQFYIQTNASTAACKVTPW